jgi:uncharacterized membrane protein
MARIGSREFIYNLNMSYLCWSLLLILIGVIFGLTQEVLDTSLDTKYAIDFWSITHYTMPLALFFLFYLLINNKWGALVVSLITVILYEVLERYWESLGFIPSFSSEIYMNIVADLIFNVAGIITGFVIIALQKPCQK